MSHNTERKKLPYANGRQNNPFFAVKILTKVVLLRSRMWTKVLCTEER